MHDHHDHHGHGHGHGRSWGRHEFGFRPHDDFPGGPPEAPDAPDAPPFPPGEFPGFGRWRGARSRRGFPPFPVGRGGGFGPGFGPGSGFGPGFGFGRGGHRGGHGRGNRARRGDVRAAVLTLLADRPMHGYEMIKEITERSGGWWRPSPGSVYPTLQLLADEGLIVTGEEGGGGKRLYTLTEAGVTEAGKLDKTPPWEQEADDAESPDAALRDAVGGLMNAVFGVSSEASPDLNARAAKVLTEARQQIYLLLANAEPGDSTAPDDVPEDTTPA